MPNDRENDRSNEDANRDRSHEEGGRKRTIGKGMTSPDSTQVPLKAETGEPDYDAIKGRVHPDHREDESDR